MRMAVRMRVVRMGREDDCEDAGCNVRTTMRMRYEDGL